VEAAWAHSLCTSYEPRQVGSAACYHLTESAGSLLYCIQAHGEFEVAALLMEKTVIFVNGRDTTGFGFYSIWMTQLPELVQVVVGQIRDLVHFLEVDIPGFGETVEDGLFYFLGDRSCCYDKLVSRTFDGAIRHEGPAVSPTPVLSLLRSVVRQNMVVPR